MSEQPVEQSSVAAEPPVPGPATQGTTTASDVLWLAGLGLAVVTLLAAAVGVVATPGLSLGLAAAGLGLLGAFLAFTQSRQLSVGALVTIAVAGFAAMVASRPKEIPIIALADAPGAEAEEGTAKVASNPGLVFWPGPVALSVFDLPALGAVLATGTLVSAHWSGAWYAATVLSVSETSVRVHFVGWEASWDATLPASELRGLEPGRMPKAPALAAVTLGSKEPQPNALTVAVYQDESALDPAVDLSGLRTALTLYALRIDVDTLPVERVLPGIDPNRPFALKVVGALRLDQPGTYKFPVLGGTSARLWIDEQAVDPGADVTLPAGVHNLRSEVRHSGPTLTFSLRFGMGAEAPRAIDMRRDGVATVFQGPNGTMRLVLSERVLFDTDQDTLNASAVRALDALFTSAIAPAAAASLTVEGHTDNRGTSAHNLDLSQRRAERVRTWLVARGRDANQTTARALGETRPRAPNDDDSNRRLNRRVEIVIEPRSGDAAPRAPAVSTSITPVAPPSSESSATLQGRLEQYYKDLNAGTFDANRYFEPSVERYITMMNTSTTAMNHYIRDVFPKQFQEHFFEMESGSLQQEGPGQYVFVEHSRYKLARKAKLIEQRYRVRIRVTPAAKLTFLQQFQKLPFPAQ